MQSLNNKLEIHIHPDELVQCLVQCNEHQLQLCSSATEEPFDGRSCPVFAACRRHRLTPCVTTASLGQNQNVRSPSPQLFFSLLYLTCRRSRGSRMRILLCHVSVLLSAAAMNSHPDSELGAKVRLDIQFVQSATLRCNVGHCRTYIRNCSIAGRRK